MEVLGIGQHSRGLSRSCTVSTVACSDAATRGISQLSTIPWPEFCHTGVPELFASSSGW